MAELVGIIASGISIAQLATQVGGCIIKLKSYWSQVQQAPDDIAHLLREIDSLNLILNHIQDDQSQGQSNADDLCMRQSLQLCQQGADELSALAAEMAVKINGKAGIRRKFGSVKVVLKNDEVKRLRKRMKTAIRLLTLAYQFHTSAMVRSQPDLIVARISTMSFFCHPPDANPKEISTEDANTDEEVKGTHSDHSHQIVQQQYKSWMGSPSWLQFLFGSLELQRRHLQRKNRKSLETKYTLPRWFSSKAFQVISYSTPLDWGVKIKTYRTLPDDAPVWKVIVNDDVAGVRDMLVAGEAFITDRRRNSDTLLSFALWRGSVKVSKFLISQGAEGYSEAPFSITLRACYSYENSSSKLNHYDEIIRLLVNKGILDSFGEEIDGLRFFNGSTEIFQYLQQNIYPTYHNWSMPNRLELMQTLPLEWGRSIDVMRIAISQGSIDENTATSANTDGNTCLHFVNEAFSVRPLADNSFPPFANDFETNSRRLSWLALARELVTAGAFLHAINWNGLTPLGIILQTVFENNLSNGCKDKEIAVLVNLWLSTLHEAGIDLDQYGQIEHELQLTDSVKTTFLCQPWADWSYLGREFHLISFSYGPRPVDWYFWFSEPTDEFAGEFWAMVEKSTLEASLRVDSTEDHGVPGSWVE